MENLFEPPFIIVMIACVEIYDFENTIIYLIGKFLGKLLNVFKVTSKVFRKLSWNLCSKSEGDYNQNNIDHKAWSMFVSSSPLDCITILMASCEVSKFRQ